MEVLVSESHSSLIINYIQERERCAFNPGEVKDCGKRRRSGAEVKVRSSVSLCLAEQARGANVACSNFVRSQKLAVVIA